jgi:hypothetical protein
MTVNLGFWRKIQANPAVYRSKVTMFHTIYQPETLKL